MRPSYACLFKGFLEYQFLQQYQGVKAIFIIRYIDDIFGNFVEFLILLSMTSIHILTPSTLSTLPSNSPKLSSIGLLTFLISKLKQKITMFLPVFITKTLTLIATYVKIPSYRHIYSDEESYKSRTAKMFSFFVTKGYPETI